MSRTRVDFGLTRRVVLVAVTQALVLSWLANLLPTWQDEEFTLATTAHGIGYAIHRALTYELQAPLYFAVLGALRTLDPSVFFAREFSVAAQVGTTLACAAIGRRVWPERDPWVFCALVASNPFTVFAAMEIRTYSLSLFESAALFVAFFDGFFDGARLPARLAFIAIAILGLYTQYFIAFEIAALFVALAVAGRFTALRDYVVCTVVALIAFVPLGVYVRGQASDTLSVEASTPHGFGGMLLHPVNLILERPYGDSGGRLQIVLWIALRLGLVAAIVLGRPKLDRRTLALISVFVVVDLIYVVLSDVLKLNLIVPRHFIALFLPEAVLAYVLVARFTSPRARAIGVACAAIFAIANVATVTQTYASGAKLGDARRVGAYLTANAKPGDAIAAYPGDAVPPIARYYAGALPIEGYPIAQNPVHYEVDAALVRTPAEASAAFDRLPRAKHLWFVMVGLCDAQNIHGCRTVQSVMNRRYRVVRSVPFFQTIVFELASERS